MLHMETVSHNDRSLDNIAGYKGQTGNLLSSLQQSQFCQVTSTYYRVALYAVDFFEPHLKLF